MDVIAPSAIFDNLVTAALVASVAFGAVVPSGLTKRASTDVAAVGAVPPAGVITLPSLSTSFAL